MGVSSLLLRHPRNNMISVYPSTPSAIQPYDHQISPLSNSNKLCKQTPKLPKIIRTSPSEDASHESWTNLKMREPSTSVEHLLKPA